MMRFAADEPKLLDLTSKMSPSDTDVAALLHHASCRIVSEAGLLAKETLGGGFECRTAVASHFERMRPSSLQRSTALRPDLIVFRRLILSRGGGAGGEKFDRRLTFFRRSVAKRCQRVVLALLGQPLLHTSWRRTGHSVPAGSSRDHWINHRKVAGTFHWREPNHSSSSSALLLLLQSIRFPFSLPVPSSSLERVT